MTWALRGNVSFKKTKKTTLWYFRLLYSFHGNSWDHGDRGAKRWIFSFLVFPFFLEKSANLDQLMRFTSCVGGYDVGIRWSLWGPWVLRALGGLWGGIPYFLNLGGSMLVACRPERVGEVG